MLGELFHGISDFFEASFDILPYVGNIPSFIIIITGSVIFIGLLLKLNEFGKEDKEMERPQGRNIN